MKLKKHLPIIILLSFFLSLNLSVMSKDNYLIENRSNSPKVSVGEFVISFPSLNYNISRGAFVNIEWTSPGSSAAFVDINLTFPYGEANPIVMADDRDNDGTFWWDFPWTLPEAQGYRVAIYASGNPTTEFGASGTFNVYPNQTINITQPITSTTWEIGTTQTISWTWKNSVMAVDIDLYKNSIFNQSIVSGLSNVVGSSNSYEWTIPSDLVNASYYSILVIHSTVGADYNYSADFTLTSPSQSGGDNNNGDKTTPPTDLPIPIEIVIIVGSISALGIVALFFIQRNRKLRR